MANEKSQNLWRLYLSSAVSGTGNWLTSLVIFIWVFEVTKSATWMSFGILAHRLPLILGAYLFASYAEKAPIKTHIRFDVLRGLLIFAMAFVVFCEFQFSDNVLESKTWVILFLLLAGLRSLTSGPDPSLKAKILANNVEKEVAVKGQKNLQTIFSLTGILASILFFFGILQVSFIGVLIFDGLTFLVSAVLLYKFSKDDELEMSSEGTSGGAGVFAALLEAPQAWQLIVSHSIRVAVASIAFQASLIVLRTNFNMGPESTGILYFIFTGGWFLSSYFLTKKAGIEMKPVHFSRVRRVLLLPGFKGQTFRNF